MKKTGAGKTVSSGSTERAGLRRRDFFKLLGAGIFIIFETWDSFELMALPAEQRRALPADFNAFLWIAEDGSVSCYTGKIEMGQGIITSLAQMMADELDVEMEKVKMVMGDTDLCPWDMGTFGSMTTRFFAPPMRAAAAEARTILLQLGAERLGVPQSQLEVKNGIITDKMNDKNKVSYAELTKGKKIEKHLDIKPNVKDYTQFKIVGKPNLHQDARLKVTGQAKYSGDMLFPDTLFARVLRPPSHGAKLVSADVSEAEKMEGIKVVREGDFIAVLHKNRDKADEAIVKVNAEYSFDEMKVDDKTIFEHLLKTASSVNLIASKGDLATGRQLSETVIDSEFYNSYVAHAPIEPHTAAARMEDGKITVWASTQRPFPVQETISRELGIPLEKVRVNTPFVGGGFGGKSASLQASEAARLAKITGKPVMVAWTREEEFFYDTFRPAAVVKITSGMNKSGKINLWDYHVYYAGDRGSDTIYDVPNAYTTSHGSGSTGPKAHPFGTGAWRAPGNNTNTFARESQINILASKAGIDPLEFRLKNLKDERMIGVLKAVAELFGYTPAKNPSGRGYGIACGTDTGTYVAHIAEVKVDKKTGHVQVVRVACAQDMGLCINPEGSIIQMEGCITMGLGYCLTEEIQFQGGKIDNLSFDAYELPRFSWLPKISTLILDKKDQPPQGGGEPAIICMGGLIANAIFDATGARLFQLPMTPARILEAIKKIG
ncbi:MAG: molybdopterin-dependent oxidoreductase [Bacteroidia bacterium]|nr:molybdopterin-dependent oxidoreductase [Bacteroidia bacterium]